MSFHSDAANGVLDEASLDTYLKGHQIDEQSTEKGKGTVGLTALALAARNGHVNVVRILLDKGAQADALSTQNRTPLWIMTARGRGSTRAEIVGLLLQQQANAKYSHPELDGGSTPLENELRQLKDPEVVQLLVNAGGTTNTAQELASKLGDPEMNDAMESNAQRSKFRATIVDLIAALISFILAWLNSPAATGIANKIFNRFQISGNKDSPLAKKIAVVS